MRRLLVVLALVTAACGGGGGESATPTPAAARPTSTGTLKIVSPVPGSKLQGGTVRVEITLTGATVVEQTSQNIRPNEGHIHLSLDGKIISMTSALITDIPAEVGHHVVQVEFVAADHAPFSPRVIETTAFDMG